MGLTPIGTSASFAAPRLGSGCCQLCRVGFSPTEPLRKVSAFTSLPPFQSFLGAPQPQPHPHPHLHPHPPPHPQPHPEARTRTRVRTRQPPAASRLHWKRTRLIRNSTTAN